MKTKQEQIKAIKQIIDERVETTLGQVQGRHGNVIKTVDTVIIAQDIVNAGYGDVTEYKAEREMLGSQIKALKQCLNNKCVEVYNLNRDYCNAFERLKAQEREIGKLKEENETLKNDLINSEGNLNHITTEFKQLQTNAEILARGVRDLNHENYELTEKIKQAQIDVLNKVKNYIDDKIENDYGDMSDSVNYLTIDIDDFDDFIDELTKGVEEQ